MNTKPIIIMLSYARSGGTLLNRCLSSVPGIVMLSEVNIEALCPSSCNTIKDQVMKWYGINLRTDGFMENIEELYRYCLDNKKTLVIRDWSFGSFVPSRYNNFKPSKKLETLEAISEYFPVISFAFVRNPIDVWLSFKSSPRTFYDKKLEYLYEFIKSVLDNKIKVFRYEDFCMNPEVVMNSICDYVGIKYSNKFKNFSKNFNVTGDTDMPDYSRCARENNIFLPARREISDKDLEELRGATKSGEINKLLGY